MPLGNPIATQNESRVLTVTVTSATKDTYIIEDGYNINHLAVYRNGIRLSSGNDYLANNGSTVQFINTPFVTDVLEFHIFGEFNVNDAIVGAASSQVISGDLVINGTLYTNSDVVAGQVAYANVAGVATVAQGLTGSPDLVVGIVTATEFYGDGSNLSGIDANYSPVAGIATYAETAGIATYATTAGIATDALGLTGTPSITVGDITAADIAASGDLSVRNVTGVAATFTGNLNVLGTITYQDVSAIDSVGVITAQNGIDITGGALDGRLGNYSETVNVIGNTGATPNINYASGTFVTATLDQSATFTFSSPPSGELYSFALQLTNGAGGPFTVTWPAAVKWPGGSTPVRTTTDGRMDVYAFYTADGGTNWYGAISQYDYN